MSPVKKMGDRGEDGIRPQSRGPYGAIHISKPKQRGMCTQNQTVGVKMRRQKETSIPVGSDTKTINNEPLPESCKEWDSDMLQQIKDRTLKGGGAGTTFQKEEVILEYWDNM